MTSITSTNSKTTYFGDETLSFAFEILDIPYQSFILPEDVSFLRDSHITLYSQTHLHPYPLDFATYRELFELLLPESANHFILIDEKPSKLAPTGHGFAKSNLQIAQNYAKLFSIPHKQAKTCIEGGNCFLFKQNEKKTAIVGELSLILSYLALMDQEELKKVPTDDDIIPSFHAIRIARNLYLHTLKRQFSEIEFKKMITAPLTELEKTIYFEAAKAVETHLRYTRMQMAYDLNIDENNLIIIPQEDYHIDMKMTVTPQGTVLLNDHEEVLEFLKRFKAVKKLSPIEIEKVKCYEKTAAISLARLACQHTLREETLKRHGIDYKKIAAVFEDSSKYFATCLNFCNGIFNADRFITTGPTLIEQSVYDAYVKYFKEQTGIHLVGLNNFSRFVARYMGGIRCLTSEDRIE